MLDVQSLLAMLGSRCWLAAPVVPTLMHSTSTAPQAQPRQASGRVGTSSVARLAVVAICSALGRSLAAMRQRDTSGASPLPVCRSNTRCMAVFTSQSMNQAWAQGREGGAGPV